MTAALTAPLPPNATALERELVAVDARTLAIDTDVIRRVKSPAECPPALLPWLAWEESVDVWDPDWTEARKREAIAVSWQLHRTKGTLPALVTALRQLGYELRVVEWFEAERPAFTFRIEVAAPGGAGWRERDQALIVETAIEHKNVRSFLEALDVRLTGPSAAVFAGAVVVERLTIRPTVDSITRLAAQPPVFAGAVAHGRLTIRPLIN